MDDITATRLEKRINTISYLCLRLESDDATVLVDGWTITTCIGSAIVSRWTKLFSTTMSQCNCAVHVQHICSSSVHTMDCASTVVWRNRHNFTAITSECSKQLWQPVYSIKDTWDVKEVKWYLGPEEWAPRGNGYRGGGDGSAPSTPHLSVTAKLNALEASCSFGDQDTYCDIIIMMNGAVKSTAAANATFNRLTSNMMYQISARAINRCGDFSETSVSHWTLPEAPPTSTIRVHESLINGSVTQLNIYWSHIGGNVSQYVVKFISGMNTFTSKVSVQSFCVALSCAYNQTVKTTGSGYTITISSVNDGGVGLESDPVQGIIVN
ncbi:hypothetical protein EMCRGX_G015135 [Ephydatia muelleri]